MAGPGIRYYEFAKTLSDLGEVTLAVPNECDLPTPGFETKRYDYKAPDSLKLFTNDAETIIIQGYILHFFPFLKFFEGKVVVDLYNPFQFESLEMFSYHGMGERLRIASNDLSTIKSQLQLGDLFICASERQRDLWLGMLSSVGRINPKTYDQDKTLRKLIDVVPFGIPAEKPKHTRKVMKGVIENIGSNDKVVLWGGGIWNWLDPITPIKAMGEICRKREDINLIFLGVEHPDPRLPQMKKVSEAIDLSKKMGLYNKNIFFNKWVDYKDRQNFLLESDIGISAHPSHIETRFSFRTRILDYIWAGLPIITTKGDWSHNLVERYSMGKVVDYKDYLGWARAISEMIDNTSIYTIYKNNVANQTNNYIWPNAVKPLRGYFKEPYYASDKKYIHILKNKAKDELIEICNNEFKNYNKILLYSNRKDFLFKKLNKEKDINFVPIEFLKDIEKKDDYLRAEIDFHNLEDELKKSKRYEAAIIRSSFKPISYQDLYSIISRILILLKKDGLLGIILPGLPYFSRFVTEKESIDTLLEKYIFTVELLLKNIGFKILDKTVLKHSAIFSRALEESLKDYITKIEEILGEPRIIKLDRKDFRDIKLISRFDILRDDLIEEASYKEINKVKEESTEKEPKVKKRRGIRRYFDFVASLYFENIRRSYNKTMQSINHNVHLQLNRETNQINSLLRNGLLAINSDLEELLSNKLNRILEEVRIIKRSFKLIDTKKLTDHEVNNLRQRIEDISSELSLLENFDMRISKQIVIFAKK